MSSNTALLVIDMQPGLVDGAYEADAVLDWIADLIGPNSASTRRAVGPSASD